ncbi:MAG: hypothetical protein AAF789_10345 [Bacteroidota bacterium]
MLKIIFITTSIFLAFCAKANYNNDELMRSSMEKVLESTEIIEIEGAIKDLLDIAKTENKRWEPLYYAAYGQISLANKMESSKDKDAELDKARTCIEQAKILAPDHSEILALDGYLLIVRLQVDPASRGMHYSQEIFDTLYKAVRLDQSNPRAHMLLGRMKIGIGKFMGTGSGNACQSIQTAMNLYNNVEETENPYAPRWGKTSTQMVLKNQCN